MLAHRDAWGGWLEERGYSAATVKQYRSALTRFCRWLDQQGEQPVTLRLLQSYFAYLARDAPNGRTDELGLRPRTARGILAALRSYRDFVEQAGLDEALPDFRSIRPPKLDHALREVPTTEEVQRLWAAVEGMPATTPYRTWRKNTLFGILLFACHSALRREEILSLRTVDVRPNWHVMVRSGKGGQAETMDLSENETFQAEYRRFLAAREVYLQDRGFASGWLFHSIKRGKRLSREGYEALWNELLELARLDRRFTLHCLRHWFTSVVEPEVGLAATQAALRHRRAGTTLQYLHSLNAGGSGLASAAAARALSGPAAGKKRKERPARRQLPRRVR